METLSVGQRIRHIKDGDLGVIAAGPVWAEAGDILSGPELHTVFWGQDGPIYVVEFDSPKSYLPPEELDGSQLSPSRAWLMSGSVLERVR